MNNNWMYAKNSFLLLANRSLKRFNNFIFAFIEALKAESGTPEISEIHHNISPVYLLFKEAYALNKSKTGIRKGDTNQQKEMFSVLQKEKMPDWHRKIAVAFPPKTTDYIKVFPQGMEAFYQFSYEDRLVYLNNIILQLGTFPQFDAIVLEMKSYRDLISEAHKTQQQTTTGVKSTSDDLKMKSEALAKEVYGALGLLMYHFRDNPSNILKFFNLTLLRNNQKAKETSETVYEVIIPAAAIKEAGFSFKVTEKLLLYNSGDTILRCWFAELPDAPVTTNCFDIAIDTEMEVNISQYAKQTDRFLMIHNLSTENEGIMEIETIL